MINGLKSALSLPICVFLCGFALSCATGKPPIPIAPLVITSTALPVAVIVPYSTTLASTGGKGAFTSALASGTLPPELIISTGGVISGTPSTHGFHNLQGIGHRFPNPDRRC